MLTFAFSDANGTQQTEVNSVLLDKNSETDDDFTSWANTFTDVKKAFADHGARREHVVEPVRRDASGPVDLRSPMWWGMRT